MTVTDKHFSDWESSVFGYGYGTGEGYIIPKLRRFLMLTPADSAYDYALLEKEVGPESTWFLINILCREDMLTYGTSPRYAWLTGKGLLLREFVTSKTEDELFSILDFDENQYPCGKDYCNCGHDKCPNPLWRQS